MLERSLKATTKLARELQAVAPFKLTARQFALGAEAAPPAARAPRKAAGKSAGSRRKG